jgi:hypothetical protein
MNPLKSLESALTSLVEGAFGRVFRSEVRPMELARKLAREMDEHRTVSVSRVYAPNEYAVWLSPPDRARYEGVEDELIDELCAYLLEHARAEGLTLASPPLVTFHTDDSLALGEFGIQARLVRPEEHEPAADGYVAEQGHAATHGRHWHVAEHGEGGHGETLIYSAARRLREQLEGPAAPAAPRPVLLLGGRRLPISPAGAVVGRSRDCDIILDDTGVSRRHARIRPADGGWTIEDLGSTNGVLLNGAPLHAVSRLHAGDRIELGSTEVAFELR